MACERPGGSTGRRRRGPRSDGRRAHTGGGGGGTSQSPGRTAGHSPAQPCLPCLRPPPWSWGSQVRWEGWGTRPGGAVGEPQAGEVVGEQESGHLGEGRDKEEECLENRERKTGIPPPGAWMLPPSPLPSPPPHTPGTPGRRWRGTRETPALAGAPPTDWAAGLLPAPLLLLPSCSASCRPAPPSTYCSPVKVTRMRKRMCSKLPWRLCCFH